MQLKKIMIKGLKIKMLDGIILLICKEKYFKLGNKNVSKMIGILV